MSDKSNVGVGELIFTDDGKSFDAGGGNMYDAGSYIVLVGGAGEGSNGGSIQLWFYDLPEFWSFDRALDSGWRAEYIPKSDPGRTWKATVGKISAVVSVKRGLAIVAFKFTAMHPSAPVTREIEGFWRCNEFGLLTDDSIHKD